MSASVPLWAFVALGLAAPLVALLSVAITTAAENRRSHRNWLRQRKYEVYDELFSKFHDLKRTYGDFLDAPLVTTDLVDRLRVACRDFQNHYERTGLMASLRVSLAMQDEMMKTWFDIYFQLKAAKVGEPPSKPHREWGDSFETMQAARYDLGSRRDPLRWRGARQDRDHVVRHRYVKNRYQHEKKPTLTFEVPNPYEESGDDPPSSGTAASKDRN